MTSIKLTDTQLVLMSAAAQREDRCLVASQQLRGNAAAKVAAKLIEGGLAEETPATGGLPVWRRDADGERFALTLTVAGMKAIHAGDDEGGGVASPTGSMDGSDKFGWSKETGGLSRLDEPGPDSGGGETVASETGAAGSDASEGEPASTVSSSDSEESSDAAAVSPIDPNAEADGAGQLDPAETHPPSANPLAIDAPRSGTKLATLIEWMARPVGATIDELTGAIGWLPHTVRAAITGLRKRNYRVSRTREEGRGTVYRIGDSSSDGGPASGGSSGEGGGAGPSASVGSDAGAKSGASRRRGGGGKDAAPPAERAEPGAALAA